MYVLSWSTECSRVCGQSIILINRFFPDKAIKEGSLCYDLALLTPRTVNTAVVRKPGIASISQNSAKLH